MQVRNNVTDILVCDWPSRPNSLPVWMTKIWPSGDHNGSEALVAHECKVAGIRNLLLSLLMTRNASRTEESFTAVHVSLGAGEVRG
jgi:hypothetical protein